jgi:hypothetical protein
MSVYNYSKKMPSKKTFKMISKIPMLIKRRINLIRGKQEEMPDLVPQAISLSLSVAQDVGCFYAPQMILWIGAGGGAEHRHLMWLLEQQTLRRLEST